MQGGAVLRRGMPAAALEGTSDTVRCTGRGARIAAILPLGAPATDRELHGLQATQTPPAAGAACATTSGEAHCGAHGPPPEVKAFAVHCPMGRRRQ